MNLRTRIALLITELHPAGAERVVFELATRLDRDRFEVLVCSLTSPEDDDGVIAAELREAGIAVVPIRMRHKLDVFGARRLVRAVHEFRPHVLHANLFHANLAARLLGRRAGAERIVSTIHIVEHRPLRLRRILERLSAGRDDKTVCVSEAVARHARADLGVAAPLVIHNGIDLGRYRDLPPRIEARARFGLPAGPVIGAVGRLTYQKGCDVLLRAFAALPVDGAAPNLLFAGAGEEAESLHALARELGVAPRVHFAGFQRDVRQVYAALDIFCMPSRWEGFGLALVEALASGVPVVATAVDSLPEVLGDLGAGLLVPPDQPVELAAALQRILSEPNLAAELRTRGQERAAEFSIVTMVAGYEALYTELRPAPA